MTPPAPLLYITGTNTNVGKTFLSTLLLQRARQRGLTMAALKPFCSGGRDDAHQLHALQTAGLTLDQINPFHFPEPVTPPVAARQQGVSISPASVLQSISNILALGHPTLLEGAGGLLSPLAENFTLRDLIQKIPGPICVVAPNTLGAINPVLLTLEALPKTESKTAVVLMSPRDPDPSTPTNASLIREFSHTQVFEFPFVKSDEIGAISPTLDRLLECFLRLDVAP